MTFGTRSVVPVSETTDKERFEVRLWDIAPDRWVDEDPTISYGLTNAKMVGDRGNEAIILEVERYQDSEGD